MSLPAEGPLPIIDLGPGATVEVRAVSPTTGADVAGVSLSQGILYATGDVGAAGDEQSTLRVWLQPGID